MGRNNRRRETIAVGINPSGFHEIDSLKAGFQHDGINPSGFHESNSLKAGFQFVRFV